MFKKILILAFAALLGMNLGAQNIITATLTFTGNPAEGATITVNGSTVFFTNNVNNNFAQIKRSTNGTMATVSNTVNHYISYPVSQSIFTYGTNYIRFQSYIGSSLSVTNSAGYATLAIVTNAITPTTAVRVPASALGPFELTNVCNGIIALLSHASVTSSIPSNAVAFINFASMQRLTNALAPYYTTNQVNAKIAAIPTNTVLPAWQSNIVWVAVTNVIEGISNGVNGHNLIIKTNYSGGSGSTNSYYNTNLPAGQLVTNGNQIAIGTNLSNLVTTNDARYKMALTNAEAFAPASFTNTTFANVKYTVVGVSNATAVITTNTTAYPMYLTVVSSADNDGEYQFAGLGGAEGGFETYPKWSNGSLVRQIAAGTSGDCTGYWLYNNYIRAVNESTSGMSYLGNYIEACGGSTASGTVTSETPSIVTNVITGFVTNYTYALTTNSVSVLPLASGAFAPAFALAGITTNIVGTNGVTYWITNGLVCGISTPSTAGGLLGNLLAYWTMDETSGDLADISGNGNTMFASGSGMTYSTTGKITNAITFDGGTSKFQTTSKILPATDFTVSLWFNSTDATATARMYDTEDNGIGIALNFPSSEGQVGIYLAGSTGGSHGSTRTGMDDGYYHHICVVHEGNNLQLYIDGTLDTDFGNVGTYTRGSGNDCIGGYSAGTQQGLVGNIDEVGVWGKALTLTDIGNLYNSAAGLPFGSFTSY